MGDKPYVLEVSGMPGCSHRELAGYIALVLESEGFDVSYSGFPVAYRSPGEFLREGERFWKGYFAGDMNVDYHVLCQGPYHYGTYASALERSGLVPPGEGKRSWLSLENEGVPWSVDGVVWLSCYEDTVLKNVRREGYPSWHWDEFFVNRLCDSVVETLQYLSSGNGKHYAHVPEGVGVLEHSPGIEEVNRAWEIVLEEKRRRVPFVSEKPPWPVTESGTYRF